MNGRSRVLRRSCAIAAACALWPMAGAHLAGQTPTFKTAVAHVLLDVVVTDKDDRPITDLTADDFEVIDRSKAQVIADFESVQVQLANRVLDSLKTIPGPPPDVFTNAKPPHSGRAIVIWVNSIKQIVLGKRVFAELARSLSPGDRVAITYGSKSDVAQDFTRDVGLLMRAFDRYPETLGVPRETPGETMRTAVNVLSDAPELRKLVIAVSDSLPWDAFSPPRIGPSFFEQLDRARKAGIPVYVVSPQGLEPPDLSLDEPIERQTPEIRMAKQRAMFAGINNMRTVAEYTGGRALVALSDPVQGTRDLLMDAGSYYLLGFYPNPDDADGKFHAVEVKVKRPGAHVRARLGYTAPAATAASPPTLASTLGAAVPGGDLELRGFAVPVNASQTWLTTEVQYPTAELRRGDDELQLTWIAIDPDAKIRARGSRAIRVPLGDAPLTSFALVLNDVLGLSAEALTIRVAVGSRLLGTRGTIHVPVVSTKRQRSTVSAAPLVVGAQPREPVRTIMLSAGPPPLPFQPSTRREFSSNEVIRVWSRLASSDIRSATLVIKRGGASVRELITKTTPAPGGAVDCDAIVKLDDLPAGSYSIELTLPGAALSQPRSVAFEIR